MNPEFRLPPDSTPKQIYTIITLSNFLEVEPNNFEDLERQIKEMRKQSLLTMCKLAEATKLNMGLFMQCLVLGIRASLPLHVIKLEITFKGLSLEETKIRVSQSLYMSPRLVETIWEMTPAQARELFVNLTVEPENY